MCGITGMVGSLWTDRAVLESMNEAMLHRGPDGDGFFWYRGRVDDLIKVGGIWVAPAEIEHCLVGHPDVVECAVVGAARNGLTIPRAYVVVRQPL